MPSTYSDVAIEELRDALAQAYDEFNQRWGHSAGTPSLVAHMGKILFEQRLADLDAGKRAPSILRLRGLLDEMKRTRGLSEKSFHGNNRQQTVLATRLRKLTPYALRGGRVLTIIGPEHPVDAEMHLYLDFTVGAPGLTTETADTPVDEHAARARRLANDIAQFFERLLLRRPPKEVEKIEQTSKKRGLRYALALIFFPVACAAVYYYVSNQLQAYAVAFAPTHLYKRDAPRPQTLFDIPTITVVRWDDDGPIRPPYEVYKNGQLVAKTSSPYFIDERPTRDKTPDVERMIDQYRVAGRFLGVIPKITPRIATEDRVLPNLPCMYEGEARLCTQMYPLDEMLKIPLSEFSEQPPRIAVVGEEQTINLTPVLIEPPGTAVNPRADGRAETRIITDGKIRGHGDTLTHKQVFTDTGVIEYRQIEGARPGSVIQRYTVLTKEQLRNRALLREKHVSYEAADVLAVTVLDTPVTLPKLPQGTPTQPFPVNLQDGPLRRPQILCSRLPDSDTLMISVCPTACKPGECEVEIDYHFYQMAPEMVPPDTIMLKEKETGLELWMFPRDYTLDASASGEYADHETISAWVYRVDKGQRKLAQVIRKTVTLPGRRIGTPQIITVPQFMDKFMKK